MKRREFIINAFKVGTGVFLIPGSPALAEKLFGFSSAEAFVNNRFFMKLKLIWKNHIGYVQVKEIAEALGTNFYVNEAKRKIVLYYQGHRFTVTADNNFVKADGKIIQLPVEAIEFANEIYVPAPYFFETFNRTCKTHFALKEDKTEPVAPEKEPDMKKNRIEALTLEERENGILIKLKFNRPVKGEDVQAEFRNDWLYVDCYKASIDTRKIISTAGMPSVLKTKLYEYPELASIGIRLKPKNWKREIVIDPQTSLVQVMAIDGDYKGNQDEPEPPEKTDDIQQKLDEEKRKWFIDTVIIDPGHGGKDSGAVGIKKLYEKTVVLAIAKQLRGLIKKNLPGVKVIMTRDKDVFIPLKERTHIANKNSGKLFVSIHANSVKNKRVNGIETYILGPEKGDVAKEIVLKENSVIEFESDDVKKEYQGFKLILATMAQNAFMKQSEYLAKMVQEEVSKKMSGSKMKNRGVKQGPFWVMVGATMPNILVETGFISNKHDAKVLKTKRNQLRMAEGIFAGIKRFKEDMESAI